MCTCNVMHVWGEQAERQAERQAGWGSLGGIVGGARKRKGTFSLNDIAPVISTICTVLSLSCTVVSFLQMTLKDMQNHLVEHANEDGDLWCQLEGCAGTYNPYGINIWGLRKTADNREEGWEMVTQQVTITSSVTCKRSTTSPSMRWWRMFFPGAPPPPFPR